jgi:hypothetical protein
VAWFSFTDASGETLTVADFAEGEHIQLSRDVLGQISDLDGNGRINAHDLARSFVESGNDLQLILPHGGSIMLEGATAAVLSAGDFWLVG